MANDDSGQNTVQEYDRAAWGRYAALRVKGEIERYGCLDTVDYDMLSFCRAAAELAVEDPVLAERVGAAMRSGPRSTDHQAQAFLRSGQPPESP